MLLRLTIVPGIELQMSLMKALADDEAKDG